ncbi:MAG: ABC transporter ATP-binding protein [Bacillota bacterium]|nr:ABC transporter ATP-binding protein [Bacillota bacterium]
MTIELKQVSKSFGHTLALDDINITFEENKIYGLLGNNGAGKTTMLNLIANRLYADSGSVAIDGEPVADNDRVLGRLFMVSEKNLYPDDMRVGKALKMTALFYPGYDYQYALELAAKFELPLKKKITALSTGYASIFKLVLALAVNTPYLLLDEPVLGLDAQHRDMFYKLLIEKYAERPCTVIISTHLIAEAANIIEQAVIIRNGRLIKNEPVELLLHDGYCVSGPAAAVDAFCADKQLLSANSLGGLKTVCVSGERPNGDAPQGLEFTAIDLQNYFIELMNKEDAHND